ncbi:MULTISPECIES: hypothetical protein [unclassified Roseateles]|uniref:hypothetical protein n=1 Tax=unclassified Roseateles TaxID=2626991 RepID=UPI0006F50D56|nr:MULTISPECIES: hypothetical protein [unclassified Roseateles]KQW44871.1 hypothetical protein ASC81_15005 [Pelomonas sp. Root405]KRA70230.1 hypothetical protein ASD88_19165 [Pelomonas sp. Root662]
MTTIGRALVAALFVFSLAHASAQSHNTATQDTELSKRTKKLGVLVVSGYRAHVIKRGTLMNIGKLGKFASYDEPRLADAIFNAVSMQIRQEERYEISRVRIEPEAARNIATEIYEKYRLPNVWGKLLTPYYESCDCDALLVVTDGPSENPFSETAPSVGPSFSSKAAVSNSGDPIKSHMRLGLLLMLADPVEKRAVRHSLMSDVPDYSEDVQRYWPSSDTQVPQEYWGRLVAYVDSPTKAYQKALFWIGLRPSCALPYFNSSPFAQQRGQQPPEVLPGTDPSKCQPAP